MQEPMRGSSILTYPPKGFTCYLYGPTCQRAPILKALGFEGGTEKVVFCFQEMWIPKGMVAVTQSRTLIPRPNHSISVLQVC